MGETIKTINRVIPIQFGTALAVTRSILPITGPAFNISRSLITAPLSRADMNITEIPKLLRVGIMGNLDHYTKGIFDESPFHFNYTSPEDPELLNKLENYDVLLVTEHRDPILNEIRGKYKHLPIVALAKTFDEGERLTSNGNQIFQDYIDLSRFSKESAYDKAVLIEHLRKKINNSFKLSELSKLKDPFHRIKDREKFMERIDIQMKRTSDPLSSLAVIEIMLPSELKDSPSLKKLYLEKLAKITGQKTRSTDVIGILDETIIAILFVGTPASKIIKPVERIREKFKQQEVDEVQSIEHKPSNLALKSALKPYAATSLYELLNIIKNIETPWARHVETEGESQPLQISEIIDSRDREVKELDAKLGLSESRREGLATYIIGKIHDIKNQFAQFLKGIKLLKDVLKGIEDEMDCEKAVGDFCGKLLKMDKTNAWFALFSVNGLIERADQIITGLNKIMSFGQSDETGIEYYIRVCKLDRDFFVNTLIKHSHCREIDGKFLMPAINNKNDAINYEFELKLPEILPEVLVDLEKLDSYIFMNLINNAIKYSPDGGTITISVEDLGQDIKISVKDQGLGIPDQDIINMDTILTKGGRGSKEKMEDIEGCGKGLTIVKQIIEKCGGSLSVSSEGENKGTTVSFTLCKITESFKSK